METQTTNYPFTVGQLNALNREQREAVEAVVEYLSDFPLSDDPTDEEISTSLNLLKTCESNIPPEEFDGDILETIRRKFSAVFCVGVELADQELTQRGFSQFGQFSFCPVIEPCFDDASHVVIVDYNLPVCYLHEWHKAWCFHFSNLEELAEAVLNVKNRLVAQVKLTRPQDGKHPIYVSVEGGVVQNVENIPAGVSVVVLDYDVDAQDSDRIKPSPLNGELCWMAKY
ncbi:MAG: hypothetical protein NTY01_09975 [Verrucomicrobia bacterium]|nr:hypothetical protein [Verrucomicrobiota bacterium]